MGRFEQVILVVLGHKGGAGCRQFVFGSVGIEGRLKWNMWQQK